MNNSCDIPNRRPDPRHVAIIMDGNGRWAKAHKVPRKLGHQQGVEAVRNLVRTVTDLGVEYLTLYGFSSENWSRPENEVKDLMGLLRLYIKRDLKELASKGVKVRIVGNRENLAPDLVALIDEAEKKTKDNSKLTLIIAFNYGGRDEITAAARTMAKLVAKGELSPDAITSKRFASYLSTADIPDPDLVIRTSGEQRLSNFLIWQSAYSEFVFIPTLWPDFTQGHLIAAIDEYHSRDRRYGGRSDDEDCEPQEELISTAANRVT